MEENRSLKGSSTPYSDGVFYAANNRVNPFLIENVLNLTPGVSVDLGCGMGRNSIFLQNFGWKTFLIEREIIALNFLKNNFKPNQIISSDLREVNFSKFFSKIDLVLCNYVLQHLSIESCFDLFEKILPLISANGALFVSLFKRPNSITAIDLEVFLKKHSVICCNKKHWKRWDHDHGPLHFHEGTELFFKRKDVL